MTKSITNKILMLLLCWVASMNVAWAGDVTYSPVLDVNFRTNSGNTGWQTVKDAAVEGNNDFELTYTAGFFALQKYTVADLQNATKLVLTLTVGSKGGVDAVKVWPFAKNDWTEETGTDDLLTLLTNTVGIAPRATEGTVNTPPINGSKVTDSNPAKATFTITGTALAAIKANATADGTFTLLLTNDKLLDTNNKRGYLSNNTANDEANRPSLVATIETPAVINKTTGAKFGSLKDAFAALTDADTELEVYEDQTLSGRLTWSKAHTLTITPKADITIKGHTNQMWFLVNTAGATLNIGSADHTITLDGDNKTFGAYGVTCYENTSVIALKNVTFQNFDLNNAGWLVNSKANEGQIILDGVTFKNCKNPASAFINKLRVTDDRLVLKGYLNIDTDCVGTAIYAASETKESGTTGRIKIDDANFTASNPISIEWPGTKADGIVVVIGTSASNAEKFQLTDDAWTLSRKSNGNLVLTKPTQPTAKIGDTGYADLAAAQTAAVDGDIIELLADQEISSRVNIQNKAITINGGGYSIKRSTSYTNGLVFLTVKPGTDEKAASLTLENVTLDGQNTETTFAFIEAGNNGTTTLNNVTVQNVKTSADAAIINKGGGKLILNGVTFTNNTAADVFEGSNLTLKGENTIPSIYVEKQLTVTATGATFTNPVELKTDANRKPGLIVVGGNVSDFTSDSFRLSQQGDDVYAMPLSVAGTFTHPGLLHSAEDIDRVKANLNVEPFVSAYAQLESASGGEAAGAVEYLKRMDKANWESKYPDYSNFTHAATDAKLAYELALRYQLKGSTAAATAAVNILNDWATTNKGVLRLDGYTNNIPDPNEYLILIQAYQFANAAELLRDYTGWQAEDFTKFQNWMRSTFADLAYQFLENHHGNENPLHYWLNWDLAALTAMYSVGVLCDDQTLVDYALNYVENGSGTGKASNAIIATYTDTDSGETLAQCQESGRDQGHATLDVTLLGAFCQMAQNQGTDLFTTYKALEMAEYVGKYNLKNDAAYNYAYAYSDMPFTTYNNGEVEHTAISSEARGTVRPCWELFYAYAQKNNKSARYCQQWSEWARRLHDYGEATSSSTDELGFGTLMFMASDAADYSYTLNVSDAGAATMVLPFEATIPSGVEVYTLNYTSGDYATTTAVEGNIPANTPVLVKAAAGNYTFQGSSIWTKGTTTDGALTGVFMKTIVPEGSYILTNNDGVLAFRKVDGTTNFVEANRAYLTAESTNAKIAIQFEDATGINNVNVNDSADEKLYNLAGQQVKGAKKGIYIKNGRKYIVK